jgi:hypothetical protein
LGIVAGQVAVPELLEQQDRGLRADLLPADVVGAFVRVGVGVPQHEGHPWNDLQRVGCPAVAGQPGLHVAVGLLPVLELVVPGEDRVGLGGG